MRKYLLTFGVILIHTLISTPKVAKTIDGVKKISDEEFSSDDDSVEVPDVVDNDTTKTYIKKGGVHSATWYNPHGHKTASGERFHKDSLTAAYNFSKMQSILKVTNVSDGKYVFVRVTDRMGIKSNNHIDLSLCAFDSLGNPRSGRINVTVEEVVNK
jgi:rare lipoprotein A (peptidoglycan hydrolase)